MGYRLNVGRGLLAIQLYLKKLEKSIDATYHTKEMKHELLDELEMFQMDFCSNIANRLNVLETEKVDNIIQQEAYFTSLKSNSRRIRPLLLFLGSLCGKENINKKILVDCGLAIEMIHKMSLILDDYFDGDLTRRGYPTFHTIYDKPVILNTMQLLLRVSNTIFLSTINSFSLNKQKKLIELYQQIIMDMGTGFIEDLDRKERFLLLEDAYRINDLQSTTILRNSLLIGYSLSNYDNLKQDETYFRLEQIGSTLGKTFQGFNDMENFLSEETQINNKSNIYSDLKSNRKNIVLGQVPRELFYSPYTDEDIIEYIKTNELIELTLEDLSLGIDGTKKLIVQLPNPIVRDNLLFTIDKVTEKTLKKFRK